MEIVSNFKYPELLDFLNLVGDYAGSENKPIKIYFSDMYLLSIFLDNTFVVSEFLKLDKNAFPESLFIEKRDKSIEYIIITRPIDEEIHGDLNVYRKLSIFWNLLSLEKSGLFASNMRSNLMNLVEFTKILPIDRVSVGVTPELDNSVLIEVLSSRNKKVKIRFEKDFCTVIELSGVVNDNKIRGIKSTKINITCGTCPDILLKIINCL